MLFTLDVEKHVLYIHRIEHRSSIYKDRKFPAGDAVPTLLREARLAPAGDKKSIIGESGVRIIQILNKRGICDRAGSCAFNCRTCDLQNQDRINGGSRIWGRAHASDERQVVGLGAA